MFVVTSPDEVMQGTGPYYTVTESSSGPKKLGNGLGSQRMHYPSIFPDQIIKTSGPLKLVLKRKFIACFHLKISILMKLEFL